MQTLFTEALSDEQKKDLCGLVSACKGQEPITLSCPLDAQLYGLLYEEEELLSCLAAFKLDEETWECCGFTRPDYREKGYFSALLEEACGKNSPLAEADLYFSVDGHCPQALTLLAKLGAEHIYDELMMKRELRSGNLQTDERGLIRSVTLSVCPESIADDSPDCPADDAGDCTADAAASLLASGSLDGRPAVSCRLNPAGKSMYLYSLEVSENLRNRGIGTAFLTLLFSYLYEKGFKKLTLQVSGDNASALALYKKTGFTVTQTLSYYLY